MAVAIQGKTTTTAADGSYSIAGLVAGQAVLTAQHQGHDNFSQTVTLPAGAGTVLNISMTPSAAAAFAGNWAGNWKNNTFGSTGTITGTVAVNTVTQTVQTTITVSGNVFGAGTPPTEMFSGPYSPTSGASFGGISVFFGTVAFNISSTGQVTGSMTNVPAAGIARVDYTGTITPTTATGTYTVTFVSGGTATGIVTLAKQ